MNSSTTCLQRDEVQSFVAGEMTPAGIAETEEHLTTCDGCRTAIEREIGDRQWWDDVEESLRAENAGEQIDVSVDRGETIPRLLDLLGPTDNPDMLGRIGTYEIVGVLGQGGMGAVFKAFDAGLNRFVAIKLLLPHLAVSGAARKRFAREGQAAAAVIDDHVLPIYSVDEWQGIPYLVAQYTRGLSLQKRLQDRGPLELKETLRIGLQAARGLAAAHAQGLVHRDVKPSNILLDGSVDRAVLTDFGLARAVDDASMTRTGVIAGTPQYMSPEQARGEFVDQRSDLFSLGSVLYAMCTGRAPFRAETSYGVLRRITDEEPKAIREIDPDIPQWLCEIIAKLMSKQSGDRFESAREVAELLESCLAHVQQPVAVPLPESCGSLRQRSAADVESKASMFRRWPPFKLLVGTAFAFAMFFAGILIVLEWNKGTLKIECETDGVPVRIMQGDKVVEKLTVTRTGTSVRIAAGEYVVEIDGKTDGIVVKNGTVQLQRRGQRIVRILVKESARELGEKDSRELHVYCQLVDGTSVEGMFANNDQILQLQTKSGLMPIPLAKVERIEVKDDRETTSVVLVDGKHLTGFVESDGFRLRTGKKSVEVAYPTLKKGQMRRLWTTPAKRPLKVAGTKASGVWRPYTIAGATDGDFDTSWNSGDYKGWIEVDLGKMETIVEVRTSLYMWPSGNATHLVYVSDKPIGQNRKEAKLIKWMSGTHRHGEMIFAECPPETQGRYVQIHCPESVSWFCIDEFQVFSER